MISVLKAWFQRVKLRVTYDKTLTKFDIKSMLRRFIKAAAAGDVATWLELAGDDAGGNTKRRYTEKGAARAYDAERARVQSGAKPSQGRSVQVEPFKPTFKAPGNKRLKL